MTEALYVKLRAPMHASDLHVRELAADDDAALAEPFREAAMWTWMLGHVVPETAEARKRWIDDALRRVAMREQVAFVVERPGGLLAGTTRFLDVREYDGSVEIGWTLVFAAARGSWVNGRVKLLLLQRAFDAGFARVQLKTDARNLRSRAAIAAIGATFEGILRQYQRRVDGTMRDTAMFSITAQEWPAVRRALETRTAHRKATIPC